MSRRWAQRGVLSLTYWKRRGATVGSRKAGEQRALPIHDGPRVNAEPFGNDFVALLIEQPRVHRDSIPARPTNGNGQAPLRLRGQFHHNAAGLAVGELVSL